MGEAEPEECADENLRIRYLLGLVFSALALFLYSSRASSISFRMRGFVERTSKVSISASMSSLVTMLVSMRFSTSVGVGYVAKVYLCGLIMYVGCVMVSVEYLKFSRAHRWFEREHGKLAELYDGEWIAVEDEGVIVESDKDFNLPLKRLRERGLDPGKLFVGYVSKEPLVAIL